MWETSGDESGCIHLYDEHGNYTHSVCGPDEVTVYWPFDPAGGTGCKTDADCPGDTCFCDTTKGVCYTTDPVGCMGLTAGGWRPSPSSGCTDAQIKAGCMWRSDLQVCQCPTTDFAARPGRRPGGSPMTPRDKWDECYLLCQQTSNPSLCVDVNCDRYITGSPATPSPQVPPRRPLRAASSTAAPAARSTTAKITALAARRVRRGMGAKSYAQRAVGDGLHVDVQRMGDGHWRATVNANGGYAQRVFGDHFQTDVALSDNGYHASVATRAQQGVMGMGARAWVTPATPAKCPPNYRPVYDVTGRLKECIPTASTPAKCPPNYRPVYDVTGRLKECLPTPATGVRRSGMTLKKGVGVRALRQLGRPAGIGFQHGSYGNWVGPPMQLVPPAYMRGRRAVWAGE